MFVLLDNTIPALFSGDDVFRTSNIFILNHKAEMVPLETPVKLK